MDSHSEFHREVAYTSCWSPLSGREQPVAGEWVVVVAQALEVGSLPAVSSPSSHARSGWRVSSYLDGSGRVDVTHGDEKVRAAASRQAAVGVLVAFE